MKCSCVDCYRTYLLRMYTVTVFAFFHATTGPDLRLKRPAQDNALPDVAGPARVAAAIVECCVKNQGREGAELQLDDTLLLPAELTAEVLSKRFQLAWKSLVDRGQPSLALAFRALFFRWVLPRPDTGEV